MLGSETKRDRTGRYAVQERCDCCSKPIHGGHITDDEVCQGSDDPGFLLCDRKRCLAKHEKLTVAERKVLFAAGRKESRRLMER